MEHDIDTLAALNSIDTIPNNSHHGTVEGWPPSTEHAKRGSVQDWISTARLLVSARRKGNASLHVIFCACSSIEHNDNSNENLAAKRASN
jgi:hypothetical protein